MEMPQLISAWSTSIGRGAYLARLSHEQAELLAKYDKAGSGIACAVGKAWLRPDLAFLSNLNFYESMSDEIGELSSW